MRAALHRYRVPAALALAGLAPFVALSWLSVHASAANDDYVHALLNYAACIASFVGAVHWGVALRASESPPRQRILYGWSVIPALMAWAVLMCRASARGSRQWRSCLSPARPSTACCGERISFRLGISRCGAC
ncbi:DUF3429 domain-containing protein [Burkholderia pseudomultivorans]|uniref:DUF3429 domain-containing protein n=1 Tax=Burkholderia pseudomultivorans TaxID=1207504 RepID=UPI000AC6406E|nr:DUF3429 domain-containing protein [Burkholderia pseudomultivorans]